MSQFMDFGMRQLLLLRVYFPEMWWQLFALTTLLAVAPMVGLVTTLVALIRHSALLVPGLILIAVGLVPVVCLAIAVRSTERVLLEFGEMMNPLSWRHFLASIPGIFLLLLQFFRSGLTRRVQWRGVTYEFLAPDRTIVIE